MYIVSGELHSMAHSKLNQYNGQWGKIASFESRYIQEVYCLGSIVFWYKAIRPTKEYCSRV